MSHWILILHLFLANGKSTSLTYEGFPSEAACSDMGRKLADDMPLQVPGSTITWTCVESK